MPFLLDMKWVYGSAAAVDDYYKVTKKGLKIVWKRALELIGEPLGLLYFDQSHTEMRKERYTIELVFSPSARTVQYLIFFKLSVIVCDDDRYEVGRLYVVYFSGEQKLKT